MSEPTRTSTPDPEHLTATLGPTAGGDVGARATPPGYELLGLIGSGGMGVVFRARDLALARDVAVKILQDRFSPESAAAARFLDEARITGQLQHPGIPPIHQVGTLADGRPFLAMKLIKGRTLDEMLKERTNLATDRGRFLAVFEQVAQAVGYAHAHDVIHRDLKPANVMVGAFGEVQVMDWGLAKLLASGGCQPPEADADTVGTEIRSLRDGDATQAGSLLGTPAFMAPEQAIGAVAEIDTRTDVFGLGGILCVILTGSPPYVGENSESVRHLAARAKLDDAFARLDRSGAEPELIALAKRCLSPEPADRPRDAGKVAAAVAELRADAERRARQAEMERATAEVKAAEERKRRRVQRALVLSVLGLFAVAGFAGWWIESVRSARKADELTREAELKDREAELKARQLATEREVLAALKEAQVLREEGWKQADDPARWALTLRTAQSALKRAEGLLASGEPTDELRVRAAATATDLAQDERDRALLTDLDRITDARDIEFRLLIPVAINDGASRRFEAAFRSHGIDLLSVPTAEAVAWLKAHRFRVRLVTAIRGWHLSLPPGAGAVVIPQWEVETADASAAVAGVTAVAARVHAPNERLDRLFRNQRTRDRFRTILEAVTDDPFTREWWDAVERHDRDKLKQLLARPEIGRMTSRELASLADGLTTTSGTTDVLGPFLEIAHERFPGAFWVHFRMAMHPHFTKEVSDAELRENMRRHLTAALAIRPDSAIARAALGMELLERNKEDPAGLRMLRSASEADPTSPWPHLFLGMWAAEQENWPQAFRAFADAVRVDPDTGFFMLGATVMFLFTNANEGAKRPTDGELVRFINDLIAARSDHPGGYYLLGGFLYHTGDHRAALAAFRQAKRLDSGTYPGASMSEWQVTELEAAAHWEAKLPHVLGGELHLGNADSFVQLAAYCAMFEKKYVLAARFAAEGIKAHPRPLLADSRSIARFAGWAVQAAAGHGVDAADLSPAARTDLRNQALGWLRESVKREREQTFISLHYYLDTARDLAPVRDPKELAKLPPGERAEWEKFWAEVAALKPKAIDEPAVAPPRASVPPK